MKRGDFIGWTDKHKQVYTKEKGLVSYTSPISTITFATRCLDQFSAALMDLFRFEVGFIVGILALASLLYFFIYVRGAEDSAQDSKRRPSAVEGINAQTRDGLTKLRNEISSLQNENSSLKNEISSLRNEIGQVRARCSSQLWYPIGGVVTAAVPSTVLPGVGIQPQQPSSFPNPPPLPPQGLSGQGPPPPMGFQFVGPPPPPRMPMPDPLPPQFSTNPNPPTQLPQNSAPVQQSIPKPNPVNPPQAAPTYNTPTYQPLQTSSFPSQPQYNPNSYSQGISPSMNQWGLPYPVFNQPSLAEQYSFAPSGSILPSQYPQTIPLSVPVSQLSASVPGMQVPPPVVATQPATFSSTQYGTAPDYGSQPAEVQMAPEREQSEREKEEKRRQESLRKLDEQDLSWRKRPGYNDK